MKKLVFFNCFHKYKCLRNSANRIPDNIVLLLDRLKAASVPHKQCLMISHYKPKDVGRQDIIKALQIVLMEPWLLMGQQHSR